MKLVKIRGVDGTDRYVNPDHVDFVQAHSPDVNQSTVRLASGESFDVPMPAADVVTALTT